MKKIVFVGGNYNLAGGTERVSILVANGLAQHGYQVRIVSVFGGERPFFELDPSIRIKHIFQTPGSILPRTPLLIARLRRMLEEEQADVLISVDSVLALFTVPAAIGLGIRHICWEHFHFRNDLGKTKRKLARRLAARYCDDIITLTEKDKHFWQTGLALKASIRAIPNPSPFPVQHLHSPPVGGQTVLAVGRLVPEKGFDLLLDAWTQVVAQEPGWQLRIVGSGAEEARLKKYCVEQNITGSVSFVPVTQDIATHYRDAAIYCLSSRIEGFGMVLVEALSFGIPIVAFDCETGPAEILEETGSILARDGDVDGLAEGLLRMIQDPTRRRAVSQTAKARAQRFQPEFITARWVDLLS